MEINKMSNREEKLDAYSDHIHIKGDIDAKVNELKKKFETRYRNIKSFNIDDLTDTQTILQVKNEIQQIEKRCRPSKKSIKKFRKEDRERWLNNRKISTIRKLNKDSKNNLKKKRKCVLETRYQTNEGVVWGGYSGKLDGECITLWWASQSHLILFHLAGNGSIHEYRVLKSKLNYEEFMKKNDVRLISNLYNGYIRGWKS